MLVLITYTQFTHTYTLHVQSVRVNVCAATIHCVTEGPYTKSTKFAITSFIIKFTLTELNANNY